MAVEVESGAYIYQSDEVFWHNPLHDLESLWWVGIWLLLCHYDPSNLRDTTVQPHIEVVKSYGETLFNNHIYPHSRRQALTSSELLSKVKPLAFPVPVQHFIVLLNRFRGHLVTYYKIYNPMVSQDPSFFIPDPHRNFGDIFEKPMNELKDDQTELWPLDHIKDQIDYLNRKK